MLLLLGSLVACSGPSHVVDSAPPKAYRTKHPFVLHHGYLAGRNMQWPGAKRFLTYQGFEVYKTEVSASLPVEIRAQQLKKEIDEVLKESHATKVHVIAHSMGGLDARYLISTLKYQDRIASLTTLSTPHRGTPIADRLLGNPSEIEQQFLSGLLNLLARVVNPTTTFSNSDALDSMRCLTEDYAMKEFNPNNPDSPSVYYQSWGAEMPKVKQSNLLYEQLIQHHDTLFTLRGKNDGLVPVSSATWGTFRGVLDSDHIALAGHRLGGGGANKFDYRRFLASVMDEFSAKGL